jgi:putative transposase
MLRRSSHSVWECVYHIVWATKRRRRALRGARERAYCARLLRRVAEVYDMYVEALEVAADHVHVCVAIPPQLSVGSAVRKMKSMSARHMFRKFPDLKRTMWTTELWSPSYFVRTVGDRVTADVIRRYIEFHEEEAALGVQSELFPSGKAKRRT